MSDLSKKGQKRRHVRPLKSASRPFAGGLAVSGAILVAALSAVSLAQAQDLPADAALIETSPVDVKAALLASDTTALEQARYRLPDQGNMIGKSYTVEARHQDTLMDLAREHNLGYQEIVRANPDVSIWLPGEGTEVVIPRRFILPQEERRGIVINLAEMRLYYYPEPREGEPAMVETYPIGIGREGFDTPLGVTETTMSIKDPAWYPPESVQREAEARGETAPRVVPPGPDNPLGQHAILLGMPGYLIHGTNRPDGIGMRASRGCIRMFPEDVASIFGRVPVGTKVNIIDAPVKLGFDAQGQPYVQSLAPLDEQQDGMSVLLDMLNRLDQHSEQALGSLTWQVDFQRARQALDTSNGNIIPLI